MQGVMVKGPYTMSIPDPLASTDASRNVGKNASHGTQPGSAKSTNHAVVNGTSTCLNTRQVVYASARCE